MLVIRQKGKSQDACFRKTKHAKFPKKRTFLTPWYTQVRACAYQGVRNLRFSKTLACLIFFETPVLRFALLPWYRRVKFMQQTYNKKKENMLRHGNTSISKTLQLFHGSKSSIINFAWITCGCFLLVSFSGQLLNVGKVTHYRKTFPEKPQFNSHSKKNHNQKLPEHIINNIGNNDINSNYLIHTLFLYKYQCNKRKYAQVNHQINGLCSKLH